MTFPSIPWFDFSVVALSVVDAVFKLLLGYLAWHGARAIKQKL